jgi:hypothetical protein
LTAGKIEFVTHPFRSDLQKRVGAAPCATKRIVLASFLARADYFAATNAPALQVAVVGVKMGFALSSIAVISLPFTVSG